MNKKNLLLIVALLFSATKGFGQTVKVLARLNFETKAIELPANESTGHIPMRIKDTDLEKKLKDFDPTDEVLLEGYLSQESSMSGDSRKFTTVFIVESIKPVSLKRLGKMDNFKVEERPVTFRLASGYAPGSLKVSGGTVGAMVITASVLLLKGLAASPKESPLRRQLETGLIFSAGALATGAQVYEDLSKP